MRIFRGRMHEYKQVAIDYFKEPVLDATSFFLSHFHEDHVHGLDDEAFLKRLEIDGCKLYTHWITCHLLLSDDRFLHLEPHLISIETNAPFAVENAADGSTICVTALSSGHCVGSVMFLFEGSEGTVLYTGDIRLTVSNVRRMPALHDIQCLKSIQSVYFDSTFCNEYTSWFPNREDSLLALHETASKWLRESKSHRILLYLPYKYGFEYLLLKLAELFKQKIHVKETLFKAYKHIPELKDQITANAQETQLHACTSGCTSAESQDSYIKSEINDKNVLLIKPSVLWFAKNATNRNEIILKTESKFGPMYRLLYCNHSSLSEIISLLKYLQPEYAIACDEPWNSTIEEMNTLLQKHFSNIKTNLTSVPNTKFYNSNEEEEEEEEEE
ncbi:Protein artemis [Trichinella pseudospiralis]|uniref:Protein artemis n=1 Tax=Trichinella pseudospiralis TaxID=6337 RepID=A0A0V1F9V1_TRIPS|nr:Protein artemis [Trichinella pseudospiralis]